MSRRGPTSYFVVFAPGHYGNECKVLSSHHTYNAALRAIADTTSLCVRQGHVTVFYTMNTQRDDLKTRHPCGTPAAGRWVNP